MSEFGRFVPVCRYFNYPSLLAFLKRLHPCMSLCSIVNLGPGVLVTKIICLRAEESVYENDTADVPYLRTREPCLNDLTSSLKKEKVMCQEKCAPYSSPLFKSNSVPSLLVSHQGATLPFGGTPLLKTVRRLYVWSRMSFCCSKVIETGFYTCNTTLSDDRKPSKAKERTSWEYPWRPLCQ